MKNLEDTGLTRLVISVISVLFQDSNRRLDRLAF